jgi:hypothetical protein
MYKLILNPYQTKSTKEWYRLFSSGFIHADWMHLFVNMFVLYSFGNIVEYYYQQIFGDIASGNLFKSPGGFLNTAISAINTAKNLKNLTKEGLKGEGLNVLGSAAGADAIVNTVGGVVGAIFPTNSNATTDGGPTNAAPRTIVPPGANQG